MSKGRVLTEHFFCLFRLVFRHLKKCLPNHYREPIKGGGLNRMGFQAKILAIKTFAGKRGKMGKAVMLWGCWEL
ncbi:hypothetical protein BGS_1251 [Beggiatoa sp. SS]|nr:hypothetical protein BGS_1251 [Beggiatoa sp. SS]